MEEYENGLGNMSDEEFLKIFDEVSDKYPGPTVPEYLKVVNIMNRPRFYAMYKDPNNGKVVYIDVLSCLWVDILTETNKINKKEFKIFDKNNNLIPVTTKEELYSFVSNCLQYYYWSKCEWEFLIIDWPNRETIDKSRPVKIDVYSQLEPNMDIIVDLVWNFLKDKL